MEVSALLQIRNEQEYDFAVERLNSLIDEGALMSSIRSTLFSIL